MIVGFGLMGVLVAWRAHGIATASLVLWIVGGALAVCAATPFGRLAYLAIYVPTAIVGFVISRVILTVVFFLLFAPLGLVLRLAGYDLLHTKRKSASAWMRRADDGARSTFYRQF